MPSQLSGGQKQRAASPTCCATPAFSPARIDPIDRTGKAPAIVATGRSGLLCGRHFPGPLNVGDCAAVVAVRVS